MALTCVAWVPLDTLRKHCYMMMLMLSSLYQPKVIFTIRGLPFLRICRSHIFRPIRRGFPVWQCCVYRWMSNYDNLLQL